MACKHAALLPVENQILEGQLNLRFLSIRGRFVVDDGQLGPLDHTKDGFWIFYDVVDRNQPRWLLSVLGVR